jgi:hypothetical protein
VSPGPARDEGINGSTSAIDFFVVYKTCTSLASLVDQAKQTPPADIGPKASFLWNELTETNLRFESVAAKVAVDFSHAESS